MAAAITGVLGTLIAALIGLFGASKADLVTVGPQPTVTVSVPVPGPETTVTVTAPPGDTPGSGTPDQPASAAERRTTGSDDITLTEKFGVDLDDQVSGNWQIHSGPAGSGAGDGSDVSFSYGDLNWYADAARVTGNTYDDCATETGYFTEDVPWKDTKAGDRFCVRTNEHRYALITLTDVSEDRVSFSATVWQPEFS